MQQPDPSRTAPGAVEQGPSYCFVGTLRLDPSRSPVVGTLHTGVGVGVPLVQVAPTLFGGGQLAPLDQKQATVCGNLMFHNGQLALHVHYAAPGTNRITPGVSPLALAVLALMGLLPTGD